MKRKLAAIILTLTMAGVLAACGDKPTESSQAEIQQTAGTGQEAGGPEAGSPEIGGQQEGGPEIGGQQAGSPESGGHSAGGQGMPSQTETGADGSASQDSSSDQEDGVLTGKLQENKGFLFLLTSDEDKETYVFPLTEDQEGLLDNCKEGDSLKVTYKNGLPTPDNMDTVVVSVEKAE